MNNYLSNMIPQNENTPVIDNKDNVKMIPGQKLCKECGLPFTPKGRESYCTREHYRPCPVCSKPVLIKYLSDPTPCCSKECTKLKRSGAKKKIVPPAAALVANNISSSDSSFSQFMSGEKRKYIGKDGVMGLMNSHIYSVEIEKEPVYGNYLVTATYDYTQDKACDCTIISCSMLNLNNNVFVKAE